MQAIHAQVPAQICVRFLNALPDWIRVLVTRSLGLSCCSVCCPNTLQVFSQLDRVLSQGLVQLFDRSTQLETVRPHVIVAYHSVHDAELSQTRLLCELLRDILPLARDRIRRVDKDSSELVTVSSECSSMWNNPVQGEGVEKTVG